MQYGEHFYIENNKLKEILLLLEAKGFEWREMIGGAPIKKYYYESINRDYTGHQIVLEIELYKHYKFVILTTDLLLKANNSKAEIKSYDEFLKRIDTVK